MESEYCEGKVEKCIGRCDERMKLETYEQLEPKKG